MFDMKLKIELYRYREQVFGRVVEQDENLRRMHDFKIDEFTVTADMCPELRECKLLIRGNDATLDDRVFCYSGRDTEDAIDLCNKIKKAVNAINDECEEDGTDEIVRVM